MPYFHSSGWPRRFACTASAARSRGIAVQQPAAEALEPDRVLDGQAEVAQLDLAVRAGQRQRAGDRAPIVVLLDQAPRVCLRTRRTRS